MTPPDPKQWDLIRTAFASSIMTETPLRSLAQNLDGPDWPIRGPDETPGTYIDLTYSEARSLLASKGQPEDRIERLIDILRGTLSFDQPFGDMVERTTAAEARDNPLLRNFARLGIPEAFPINLTALDADTLEFCRLEKLSTLGAFAVFAQGMAQTIIIGGDFRRILNALSHVDESVLAELLPLRRGSRGLHLVEALAQAARSPDPAVRAARAIAWFQDEWKVIRRCAGSRRGLAAHLEVLGDPALEKQVAALVASALGSDAKEEDIGVGLWGMLARAFRR